jgi:hypothetical protein
LFDSTLTPRLLSQLSDYVKKLFNENGMLQLPSAKQLDMSKPFPTITTEILPFSYTVPPLTVIIAKDIVRNYELFKAGLFLPITHKPTDFTIE